MLYALVLLFLSGCMVGPKYKKPDTPLASSYVEQKEQASPSVTLWWKQFNDETLSELIDRATVNNRTLQTALARVTEARAHYSFRSAQLWPEIDATAAAIRSHISQTLVDSRSFGPPTQSFFQLGFDASWEIDFFGKRRRDKQAAWYEFEAEQDAMRNVYITLLSDVARAYIELRALQNTLIFARERVDVQQELLHLAEERFEAGLASAIEVAETLALLKREQQFVNGVEIGERQVVFRIATLIGEDPESFSDSLALVRNLPLPEQQTIGALPSELLRQRPDIRQAERILAATNAKVGVAIADLYPRFVLNGEYGYQTSSLGNLLKPPSRAWSIGPSIDWAILHFGRIRSQIKAARARYKQAFFSYEQTVLDALRDVESALIAYYTQQRTLEEKRQEALARREVALLEGDKYQSGLVNYTDALIARREALTTVIEEIAAMQGVADDFIAVYKALGGGWECSD